MKNLFKIIMLVSMGLFLNSCYYDAYPETEAIPPDVVISYENDVMPLWVQCVGCHNGNTPPDLRDEFSYDSLLAGYVEPFDSEESILYKSLLGIDGVSLMPPGSQWPDSKIDIVKTWIDQGAKDN
jgi:hypothetical protein